MKYLTSTSVEKRLEVRKIVYCWLFNIIVAVGVFSTSMYVFGSLLLALLHTFIGWALTLTMSIIYWLMWIQNKIKGGRDIKIVASSAVIIMFLIALMFVFRTVSFVMHAISL
ncbi:MAG: hypothetical protein JSV63_00310 [Candidatus Aenigmatarchaeota archaeon]|nr:MAG: hypothetical protein JSV63_00310 [Candidatus Aenigmarchaeota archaeon]